MITTKIDVTKIDRDALYKGDKGTYLDITLIPNKDGKDQYGNDGFVVQDLGKDRRLAGERGPILGNYKHIGQGGTPKQQQPPQQRKAAPSEDEIPF